MIFLDTSAVYALADARDLNHARAVRSFGEALNQGEVLLAHNYVLLEAASLLQRRLGLPSALQFLRQSESFQVHWVSSEDHRRAIALWQERTRRGLSLVDCVSFVVMRQYGVSETLAFDPDFEQEGFRLYQGSTPPPSP